MRHSLASRENFQLPHLGIRERFVRRGVAGLRQFRRLAMDALESRYLLASDITIASQVDLEKFFTPDSSAYEVDKYDEVTIAANLATRGANLTITAKKITLSPGLAIDTAASTAGQKAGSITFDAPSITVADGSSLLANGSSDDLDGDITLKAINQITVTQFSNNNQVLNLIELIRGSGGIRAHIDIGDATTIQGGDVSITSDAGNQKLFSELGALDTIFQALDYLVPTLPIAFQQWQPSSTITLGGAAGTGPRITGSESATVEATAQSHAIGQAGSNDPISPGLGSFNQWYASNSPFVVGLFQSHATASITLNNSQVSSGGDVRITTDVTNEVDLRAQSLGNNGSSNTSLQSIGLSLALSEQTTQSTIRVDAGSLISSQGDVIIRATADDSNSTVSKAYVYGDGTVSLAPAFSTGCSVVSSLIGKKQNTTCDDDTSTIVFVHMDGRVTSTGSATEGTPQPPSLSFLPAFHLNIPESRLVFEGEAAYRTGDAVSFSCSDAGSTQLCTIPGLERDTVYYVIATQNAGTYDLQFADSLEDAFNGRARSFGDSYPTLTVDGFSVPVTNTGVNREGQHLILFGYDKRPDGQPLLEEGDEVVFAASPHKFVGRFNAGALVSLVDGRSYRVRIVESEDSNYPLAIELLNDAGIPISVFGGSYLRDSESGVLYPISDVDPATGEIDVRLESLDSDGQTIVRTAPRVPMPQGARLEYHTGLNEDSASLRDGAAYWAIVDANNPGVIRLAVTADQAAASNPTTQNASPYVTAPFRGLKIPRDSEGYLASNLAGSHFTVSLLDEDGLNLTWHTFVFLSPGQDSGDEGNTNVPNNSHSDHIPIRLYYDKDQVLSVDTTADRIADALNALGWGLNARRLGSGTGEILVGTQSNLWFGLIDPNETNKAHLEEVTLQVDLPVDNFEVGTGLVFQQDTELIDGLRVVYHAVPGKPVRGLVDGRAYHVYNVPNVNLNEAVPQTILTLMNAVEASSSANGGVFDLVVTAPDGSVGTATGIAWNAAAGDVADAINRLSLPGVSVSVSGTGQIGSPWLIRGLNVGEVAVGPSTLNASGALVPLTIVEAAPGIRLGHTATEGTFSLEIMAADGSRGITSPIAWNASAAQVEALIAALNLAGTRVTVEGVGSFAEPWVLRGLNPSQVTVGMIDLRRHGESPEVRMTSNLQEAFYRGQNLEDPSGTQYLVTGVDVNKGTVTVRLPDSAPLDSADASLLTGSLDRPARVETRDIAAGAIQMFSFATGGTFTITVEQPDGSRSTTTAIAHDASPEAVAAALNALPAVGVTVTGLGQPLSPWLVTGLAYEQVFVESDLSGLEGDAMDVTMVEAVGPVHQVWLDNATGGTFTLSLRAAGQQVTTGPLSFDITLDRLNAALNALPHVVARVTGSGTSRDPWLLTSASQPVETGDPLVFRDNWDMLSMGMLDGGTYYAIVEQSQGFDPYSLPLRIAASLQDAMSTPPRPIEMRPYLPFSPAAQTPFSGAGVVLATQDAKDVPGDGVTIEASLNSSKKVASYTQLGGFPLLSYLIGGTKSALSQNTLSLSSRFTSSGGASGAVAMQWVSNDVHVTLGRTARVAAAENVVIQSSIEQELSSVSNASLSKTQKQADGSWGVAVALAASIVDNNSHAVVSSDAIVTAGKMLEVDSSITYQGRDPWRHVLKSIGETVINLLRNDRGWLGLFFNNVANVAIPQPVELGKGQIYARYLPGLSSNFQMTLVITASIAVESLENNNLAQIADGAQINDPDQTFEVIDLETGAVRFIRPPVSPAENGVTVHATTSVIQRGLTGKIHLSLPLLAAGKFRSGPSLPWAPFQKASESALGGSVNVFTVQGSNQALLGGADLIGGAPSHAATVVHFGDRGLTVQAETLNGILQLAQSGANSSKFSLEASVATVSMTGVPDVTANNEDRRQRTYAKIITSNLPVTLRPLANTAGDLNVLASDRSNGTAIAGSFLVGQAVGFGVSASVITLNRDVQASIGSQYASFDPRHLNQAAQAPGSSIVVNGAVNVDTDVNGAAVPLAVVGSFSSQVRDRDPDPPVDADPKPDSSKLPPGYLRSVMMAPVGPDDLAEFLKPAPKVAKGANVNSQEKFQDVLFYGDKKSEGKWGFLFSGDFAGAFSDDAAYSYINLDGSLTGNNAVSEDLAITSDNRTKNFALGGSVAIAMHSRGESTKNANVGGVSGSVAWNSIESDVRSTLEGASVAQFHDLNVAAENEKRVFGGSAGLKLSRAADNIVNVAGSVAINDIANTTIARIDDATVLLTGDLLVEAFSRDSVSGFAGQADLQSNVSKRVAAVDAVAAGVGMALALNQVEATTVAEVSQSRITQGGSSTRVVAEDFTELSALSLGVSVQVSSGTTIAVEGSFTINSLAPNTSAVVDRSTIRNLYQGENPRELLVSATLAPILKATAGTFELQLGGDFFQGAVGMSLVGQYIGKTVRDAQESFKTQALIEGSSIQGFDAVDVFAFTGDLDDDTLPYVLHQADSELATDEQRRNVKALALAGALQIGTAALSLGMVGATVATTVGIDTLARITSDEAGVASRITGLDEVQEVGFATTSAPTAAGTFTLDYDGAVTTPLRATATAAQVQSALEALASVGSGNVRVEESGEGALNRRWTITFTNDLGGKDVPQVTIQTEGLGLADVVGVERTAVEGGKVQAELQVQAINQLTSKTDAGGATVTFNRSGSVGSIAVGGAVNNYNSFNTTRSLVDGDTVVRGQSARISALLAPSIDAFAVGVAITGSKSLSLGLSGGVLNANLYDTAEAGASNSRLNLLGDLTVAADDRSVVDVDAGNISGAYAGVGSGAVGMVSSDVRAHHTVLAWLGNRPAALRDADGNPIGDTQSCGVNETPRACSEADRSVVEVGGTLTVHADASQTIHNSLVGVAVSASAKVAVAAGGAWGRVSLENIVRSAIHGVPHLSVAGGDQKGVSVLATIGGVDYPKNSDQDGKVTVKVGQVAFAGAKYGGTAGLSVGLIENHDFVNAQVEGSSLTLGTASSGSLLDVSAINRRDQQSSVWVTSVVAALGGIAGAGGKSVVDSQAKVIAEVGQGTSILFHANAPRGDVSVHAQSDESIEARLLGVVGASVGAVGIFHARAEKHGSAWAGIGTVGEFHVDDLTVQALGSHDVFTNTVVADGAALAISEGEVSDIYDEQLSAVMGRNYNDPTTPGAPSQITADGDVRLTASTLTIAHSGYKQFELAGTGVGAVNPSSTFQPVIHSTLAYVDLEFGGSLDMEANVADGSRSAAYIHTKGGALSNFATTAANNLIAPAVTVDVGSASAIAKEGNTGRVTLAALNSVSYDTYVHTFLTTGSGVILTLAQSTLTPAARIQLDDSSHVSGAGPISVLTDNNLKRVPDPDASIFDDYNPDRLVDVAYTSGWGAGIGAVAAGVLFIGQVSTEYRGTSAIDFGSSTVESTASEGTVTGLATQRIDIQEASTASPWIGIGKVQSYNSLKIALDNQIKTDGARITAGHLGSVVLAAASEVNTNSQSIARGPGAGTFAVATTDVTVDSKDHLLVGPTTVVEAGYITLSAGGSGVAIPGFEPRIAATARSIARGNLQVKHEASAKIEHDNQIIVDGSVRAAYSPQLFADWEASDTSYAMDYGRRKTFADENASSLDPTDFGKRGKFGSITFVDPVGTSKVEVNGEVSSGMVPLQAGIDKEGRLSVQGVLQGLPDLPTGPGASYPYAAVKPQASATSAGRFQPFLATKAASVEGAIRDILGESGWRQVREYASIPTSVPAYILRDLIAPQGSITVVANSVTGTGRIDAFRTSIHIQNHSNGWLVLDGIDSLADHRAGTVMLNDAKGHALRDVPASLVVNGLAKLDQKPVINVTVASSIRDEVRSTAGLIIAGAIVAPASHVTIANDNGPVIALASITAASLKLDVPNSTVVFNTPKADFATGGADTLQAGLENNGLDPQNASSANLLLPFLPGKAGSALDADYVASAAADYTLGNTTGKVVAQGSAVAIRPFLGKGITASQLYVFAKTIDVNAPLNIGKVEDFSLVLSAALGDQLRQFQLEYQNGEHDDPRYEIPGVGLEARGSKATYDARTNQISLSSVSLAHETRLLLDGRIASTMEGSAIKLLGGLQSAQGIVNQTGIPLVVNTVDAGSGGITGTVEFRDTQTQLNTRYTYASQNVVEVHTAPRGQAYADAPDRVVNAQQVDFRPASDLLYVSSLRQEIFKTAAAPGVFSSQNSAGWYPDGGWSYGDVAATGFANFQAVRTASLSSDARTLTLTNGTATVANAAWLRTPLDVSRSFMVAFRYEGSGEGDGATLALQTVGTSAIGASGGALGYSGIGGNKAAFKINLYNFRTGPYPGVAFDKNEASGGVYQAPGDVSVSNPMDVQLYYNAARREWTAFLTDTIQKTTKSIVFPIDMASHFGASKVYLGMTGSTGLAVSTQSMKDFMLAYDPQLSLPPTVPDGEFLRVAGPALAGFSGFVPANLGDGAITDDTVTFVSFNNVGNRPRAAWLGEKISTQADTLSVEFTYEAKANKNSPIDSFATFVPQSASYASAITPGQVVLTDGSQNVARAAWLNNEVRTTQDFTVDFTYQKEETTVTGFGDFVASTGTPATAITADKVTLTDGSKSIARAAWYKDQIPTNKSFVINFDYQASGNQDKLADGMALVFQTQGTSVVGRSGSSLGYVGIPGKKAAYQINVFPGSFFNGQQTGTNFVTNDTAGNYSIDRGVGWFPGWSNPDSWPIHVELVYDASSLTLTEKFSSDTAGRTGEYTNYYPNVNLASLLGPTTYLGFTGASGDTTATQTVTNFKLRLGTTLDSKDNGIALVFQKQGTGAVGANGSGLGYRGILGATAAYQINLGPNKGSNFVTTNTTGTYNSTGAIDFSSGHAIKVRLTYNSVRHELTETLTDLVSNSTYERRYPNVDLSALLGSTTYLGFTGGSGSSQAVSQVVRDLTFETHADNGVALVFQSSGTQATGNVDRGLGYVGIAGATAAYQINLNRVQTRGSNFVTSNTAGSYQSTGNVDFGSGHPIRVKLDFNKAVREVTETLTDLVSGATFRRTYQNVELASTLDPTTYVGFTTGTGGLQNWQVVKDFRLDRSAMQTGFEQRFGARLLSQGNGSSATAPTSYDTSTSWWVRADQPIQVDFSRMLLSPFSVTSNAPLTLNGLVRINTDLNLSAVGPITMSSSGLIEARSAKLVATGDEGQLGTSDNPLNVTLFEGALLAEAPQGVFIASTGDLKVDRISTLAVGKSVATAPVVLESAGSVLANAVSPGIQAGHLTIHSQGTVGSQALPLRIQLDTSIAYDGTALGGSLNVEATGDVSLLQVAGDLRVDSIKSPGTVTLRTLGGNILDGLTLDALQLNAPDLLPQMRDYLHKLFTQSSSGGAEERIAALEYQIDSAYRAYWRLVPPVNEGEVPSLWNNWDPGAWGAIVTTSDDQGNPQQVYQLSATGLETFRAYAAAANQKDVATDAEVQDYVNNLWRFCISQFADTMAFGPAWATQPQFLQYDPGFSFKASAETIAVIKAENEDRLDIRMFLSGEALTRFSEDSALSRPANIEAGQLNLQSAGSIGQNSQSRFIPLDGTLNYQMTPEEQRFLRLASEKGEIQLVGKNESGDTVYFTAGHRPAGVTLTGLSVAISRPLAVQLASTGSVTAIATDEILLVGNTNDLRVKQVSSSGNGFVSLAAVQNLLAADDAAVVPVRGGALRLVADGNIGSSMRPMTFSATGKVDLSSLGNAWLRTNNSLQVGLWDVAGDLNLNAFGTGTVTDSLASQRGSFSGFTGGTGWSSSATQGSAVVTSTSVDDTLQLALEAGAGAQTAWPSQVRFQKNDLVSVSDQFVLGFLYQSHATNSRVALNLGNVGQPGVAIVMNLGDAAGTGSWIDILTESGIASATSGRSPGSVVLNSGHPIQVVVSYSTLRQKLTATFTDTITQESVTIEKSDLDLVERLGGHRAKVSWHALGSGAQASSHSIQGLRFVDGPVNLVAKSLGMASGGAIGAFVDRTNSQPISMLIEGKTDIVSNGDIVVEQVLGDLTVGTIASPGTVAVTAPFGSLVTYQPIAVAARPAGADNAEGELDSPGIRGKNVFVSAREGVGAGSRSLDIDAEQFSARSSSGGVFVNCKGLEAAFVLYAVPADSPLRKQVTVEDLWSAGAVNLQCNADLVVTGEIVADSMDISAADPSQSITIVTKNVKSQRDGRLLVKLNGFGSLLLDGAQSAEGQEISVDGDRVDTSNLSVGLGAVRKLILGLGTGSNNVEVNDAAGLNFLQVLGNQGVDQVNVSNAALKIKELLFDASDENDGMHVNLNNTGAWVRKSGVETAFGKIRFAAIKQVVLDQLDTLLGPGAVQQLELIIKNFPTDRLMVVGSTGHDQLTMDSRADVLDFAVKWNGVTSNDRTFSRSEINDVLFYMLGGNDNVAITGSEPVVLDVHGGRGDDSIVVSEIPAILTDLYGNNRITAGPGEDTIHTGTGNDLIDAGDGRNLVVDDGGDNKIWTGQHDDEIHHSNARDWINAGAGINSIWLNDSNQGWFSVSSPADLNRDGIFDSADLVLAFQAGKYENSNDWMATSDEGDWDGDGRFTSEDLVLAFQVGGYELNFVAGDCNDDGVFDSADLVLAFQTGEYEDDIGGNSTRREGDWNGDGDFTSEDMVFAFQRGYRGNAVATPADRLRASAVDAALALDE